MVYNSTDIHSTLEGIKQGDHVISSQVSDLFLFDFLRILSFYYHFISTNSHLLMK